MACGMLSNDSFLEESRSRRIMPECTGGSVAISFWQDEEGDNSRGVVPMEKRFNVFLVLFVILSAGGWAHGQVSLTGLVQTIQPAVVTISTFDMDNNSMGIGSGFFVNERGDLVTNYHVLEGAARRQRSSQSVARARWSASPAISRSRTDAACPALRRPSRVRRPWAPGPIPASSPPRPVVRLCRQASPGAAWLETS